MAGKLVFGWPGIMSQSGRKTCPCWPDPLSICSDHMTVRIFKHDRNELLKQGIEIISSTNDTKYHNRVVLVNLLLTGKISISLMSKASGLTTRTLSNWLSIVDNEGFEKLRAIKQSGRPDKLSDEQKAEIKKVLRESPDKHGYCVWDGISLSDYITSKYDIEYSIRQCQRLFHELGFSLQRAGTFPSLEEQNGSEREEFKKNSRNQEHEKQRGGLSG